MARASAGALARNPTYKRQALEEADESIKRIQGLTDISRKEIEQLAVSYSRQNSSVLAGILGGVVGAAGGAAVATFAGGMLVLTGPAGAMLGVAAAILSSRGWAYHRLERRVARLRLVLDEIETRIRNLPKGTPAEVKNELWSTYVESVRAFKKAAVKSIATEGAPKSIEAPSAPLALPPADKVFDAEILNETEADVLK